MNKKDTITIIAPNIKNGGGKELLEYILEYLEDNYKNILVIVYLDSSLNHINSTNNRTVFFLGTMIGKMKLFYKKIENSLYFGNLPPLRKSKNSIVYFHNLYLLMNIEKLFSYSVSFFIKYMLQQLYISLFINNVNIVACQNNLIKDNFYDKYKFENIELLPFFRLCLKQEVNVTNKYDFCYISLAHPHKNHSLLFDALEILSKKNISLKLAVTIEYDKEELLNRIKKINSFKIVRIDNLGVIPKNVVCKLYSQSRCLIFPSKEETFGLSLIEAVEMGLDVITSDLEYVYQVIEPSLTFDSNSASSCSMAMEKYMLNEKSRESRGLVKNDIDKLINKLIKVKNV